MFPGLCYISAAAEKCHTRERGFTSTVATICFGTFQKESSLPNDQRLTEFWLNARNHRLHILAHNLCCVRDLPGISTWIGSHDTDNLIPINHLQKKIDQVTCQRGTEAYASRVPSARDNMPCCDVCGVTFRIELGAGFEFQLCHHWHYGLRQFTRSL